MNKLKSLLIMVLMGVLRVMSPEIRKLLEDMILRLWEKAKATPNEFDNIVVRLIAGLLEIDLPD